MDTIKSDNLFQKIITEEVKQLYEKGGDVEAFVNEAIRFASEKGHFEIVRFLCEKGSFIEAEDNRAIYFACQYGHHKVLNFLFANL